MSRKKIDLTGEIFGRLVVDSEAESITFKSKNDKHNKQIRWNCICECGVNTIVNTQSLREGRTTSCGCVKKENMEKIQKNYIRHINIDGTNLDSIDSKNRKKRSDNISGFTGVYWNKKISKWQSKIHLKGKTRFLGSFDKKQDAINARKEAEDKYFKPILDKYGK